MRVPTPVSLLIAGAVAMTAWPVSAAPLGTCGFNPTSLRFRGTVPDTAACLLRKVKEQGAGATAQPVPAWLLNHMTKNVELSRSQLTQYLADHDIAATDLNLGEGTGDRQFVRYFVIHDTSTRLPAGTSEFPADIDSRSHFANNLGRYSDLENRVNLIVSRDGRSRPFRDWGAARSRPATKLEEAGRAPQARQVFVHVENVQPRINPDGTWHWMSPPDGFTPAQEDRLALAYIVASMRAGRWLIPAYHFNIDDGMNAHDDPQHVDLARWTSRVEAIAAQIGSYAP